MASIGEREAAIAQLAVSEEWTAGVWAHVREIVEGEAFRGSSRSAQFLTYIVDQAIAGRFDSLKERVIGLELFERSPDYDTGDDAIVRVAASDVRRRLQRHYGKYGGESEFRIALPLGSYVPEITREPTSDKGERAAAQTNENSPIASHGSPTAHQDSPATAQPTAASTIFGLGAFDPRTIFARRHSGRRWALFVLFVTLNLAAWGIVWRNSSHAVASTNVAPAPDLPWSALLSAFHPTHLVLSDPDLSGIQRLTGSQISVSEYANHNYIPANSSLTPELREICLELMRGDKAAMVDTQIGLTIAEMAKSNSKKIDEQGARNLQFSNLKTDDNFIFLGSPQTDPWFSLFNDQLDFQITFDNDLKEEIVRDVRPTGKERATYIPTAKGWDTGESFALVALVHNPDQSGQVLLIAGLSAEGTQAAGKLVTDLPRIRATLQNCGISPSGPPKHFELLLGVKTMAGYPSQFDVISCHILPA